MVLTTNLVAAVRSNDKKTPCIIFSTGRSGMFSVGITTYCQENLDASRTPVLQLPAVSKFCDKCLKNVEAAAKQLG